MNTEQAFAMGMANRGNPLKVFDWDRAAKYIRENNIKNASAGLQSDWEWTGGDILRNGDIVPAEDTYTYLSSTWASPELDADGYVFECYIMEDAVPAEWGMEYSSIYWPESARKLLLGE